MDATELLQPIQEDMQGVDRIIRGRLKSDVVLINQLAQHIIAGGGKRLRPAVTLLCAKACGIENDQHQLLAAIIDLLHTATLLHDDVVDGSDLRRGRDTANALWGNEASVLTGDFLYSRSFQLMIELDSMHCMSELANTSNVIAEGEVMQLMNCNNPDLSEKEYYEVIRRKTAALFAVGTGLGAYVAGTDDAQQRACEQYGLHLGLAFQIIDDALDYSASADELGKNIGDDLAEGKATLPLIHVMQTGSSAQKTLVSNAIREGDIGKLDQIQAAIESTDAIAYTSARADDEANAAIAALELLPDSPYKQSLSGLAKFSVARRA
ncbi:MAG: polyprenyl synthetase family protein [Oleiphilaceae bacterium]|nr:polyprenyl synthetase family protein [Oleiphilaceae bacterium]